MRKNKLGQTNSILLCLLFAEIQKEKFKKEKERERKEKEKKAKAPREENEEGDSGSKAAQQKLGKEEDLVMQACKKGKVELLVSVFSHKEGLGLDFVDERGQVVFLNFSC